MNAVQLCPVCQGPVPLDAATQSGGPPTADCPSCGTQLIRATDGQQDPGWRELGSSSD